MNIIAIYTEKGIPRAGLTPQVTIVDIDSDAVIINAQNMTALTNLTNCYVYDFTLYDEDNNYVFSVDGGVALNNLDRYQFITNDQSNLKTSVIALRKIETGRWKIENNQMLFYDDDGTTVLYTFNLKDTNGNLTMRNIIERAPA